MRWSVVLVGLLLVQSTLATPEASQGALEIDPWAGLEPVYEQVEQARALRDAMFGPPVGLPPVDIPDGMEEALGPLAPVAAYLLAALAQEPTPEQWLEVVAVAIPEIRVASADPGVPQGTDENCWRDDNSIPPYQGTGAPFNTVGGSHGGRGGVCITGDGDGVYSGGAGSFGFLGVFIDLGGDDRYSAGSGSFGTAGVFIDMGGDDWYQSSHGFGYAGGLFVDVLGDDEKNGGGHGSWLGGTHIDGAGDDTSSTSSSSFGVRDGWYFDLGGDDRYSAPYDSFGGGTDSTLSGRFLDLAGNDKYECYQESPFNQWSACFGVDNHAYFIDGEGNDHYFADGESAYGSATIAPAGATFADLGGNDVYIGGDKSFGHFLGRFYDVWGHDTYIGGDLSFGAGPDVPSDTGLYRALAMFVDGRGDDHYTAGHSSFGHSGGFFDFEGDDTYEADSSSHGGGFWSLFVDTGGDDTYPSGSGFGSAGYSMFLDLGGSSNRNGWGRAGGEEQGAPADTGDPGAAARIHAASLLLEPEVGRPGATVTFDVTFDTEAPVDIGIDDDQRGSMTITPGPHGPGPTSLTASYVVPEEDPVFWIEARIPGTSVAFEATTITGFEVDAYPPVLVLEYPSGIPGSPTLWFSSVAANQGIGITAEDDVSGIQGIYYAIGAPATSGDEELFHQAPAATGRAYMGPVERMVAFSDLDEGVHTVHVLAVDGVGWESRVDQLVRIDRTPPAVDLRINGTLGDNGWYIDASEIEIDITDDAAGPLPASLALRGATVEDHPISPIGTWTGDPAWVDGVTTLTIEAPDAALPANVATVTQTVAVDREPPTIQLIDPAPGVAPPTVDVAANDATSGVVVIEHRTWRDGEPEPTTWTTGASVPLNGPGTHNVKARAIDEAGHIAEVQHQYHTDNLPPVASFTLPQTALTLEPISPIDASDDPDGSIAAWTWDVAGATFVVQAPTFSFDEPGTYTVGLTVEDDLGATDSVSHDIEILNRAPDPAWTYSPLHPEVGETVTLVAIGDDDDGTIESWTWTIGQTTRQGDTVQHVFEEEGPHDVVLVVEDDRGATAQLQQTIQVRLPPPISAAFDYTPLLPTRLDTVTFTDHTVGAASRTWTIDGVEVGTAATLQHTFASAGVHHVTLTVADEHGQEDLETQAVAVAAIPPVAVLTADEQTFTSAGTAHLTDASTDADGVIVERELMLDGEPIEWTDTLEFTAPGTYALSLTVTDDDGESDTATLQFDVLDAPPVAAFTGPATIEKGATWTPTDASTDDVGIATWAWDFGDGATSDLPAPSHAFTVAGQYQVTLTVTDVEGQSDTSSQSVTVTGEAPVAAWHATQAGQTATTIELGDTLQFHDDSSDGDDDIVTWAWDFGDGGISDLADPTREYAAAGTYTVSLTVTDSEGHSDTATATITVTNTAPTVAITGPETTPSLTDVTFTIAAADAHGVDIQWDAGNGMTGAGATATIQYASAGTYTFKATATDPHGAATSATATIVVTNQGPSVAIQAPTNVTAGKAITWSATVTDPDGTIATWAWDIAGTADASTAPLVAIADPGSHTVTLTVTDDGGATATDTITVDVVPAPPARVPTQDTDSKESPGIGVLALLALLALARRRS